MAKFSSEKIGGVAGNVVAISHGKIMGAIQKMEYEISTHFLRESQSAVGAVAVTPGAFSAYRMAALKKFEEGTLTEDFDTSVKVLEEGYDVIISPNALCFTQVPLSFSDIIRQRIRWQQGGLEVFSKHLFNKKKFFVSAELFLIFFFGFYGLFPKILTFVIIPLNFASQGIGSFALGFLLFLAYFNIVWFIILLIIKERRITTYLTVPLFVIYWYTLLLYSILAAQIIVFKKNKQWGTLKRYHT
jgi:cellulose synthase/poly-beta-1,6-N-acetylglucosamine synthase-like glycosyltransferase